MVSIQKSTTASISDIARDVQAELKARPEAEVKAAMQSGAGYVALLSAKVAGQVGKLGGADRSAVDQQVAVSFFGGIAALAESVSIPGVQHIAHDQVDFGNAAVGIPNPKKALRLTINLPEGFTGPDDLVYPEYIFKKDADGAAIPIDLKIGRTGEMVQLRPGEPIIEAYEGTKFEGKGFVIYNKQDSMVVPVPANGEAAQLLVNGVDAKKLAAVVDIFGKRPPGALSQAEQRTALTRVVNEVSTDLYRAKFPTYASSNFDPVDTSNLGIGLHSKKGMITSCVRVLGQVSFTSPDGGVSAHSYADGCVLIKTMATDKEGKAETVIRAIEPKAFDGDGYQDKHGNELKFDTLPIAIINRG